MRLKISDKEKKLLRKAIIDDRCFEIGFKIGFERGIIKGERKGRLEKTLEIAKNLLTMGLTALDISKTVGLSVDEINALAK